MERQDAIQEIRRNWKRLFPADKKGKGIVCPICGSGSGTHGTGITADTNHGKPDSLRCWSCGFSGDALDLIQQTTGADFNTALQNAADQLGITIDRTASTAARTAPIRKAEPEKTEPTPAEPEALADYTDYYRDCFLALLKSQDALSYLQARGIGIETVKRFLLGYDPEWISPAAVKGLEAKGSTWRPPTTRRIILPVSDNHYIARAIDTGVEKDFVKMNEVGGGAAGTFNIFSVRKEKPVFVVEGVFDALAVAEAGAEAVAINSTNRADAFLKELNRLPVKAPFILCLDNDEAGQKATATLKAGLDQLGALYEQADVSGTWKDPNEALVNEREAFVQRVKEAEATMQRVKEAEATMQNEQKKANQTVMESFLETVQSEAFRPYKTDLPFFDDLLGGGVVRQTILLLLAAPGAGKTTLCQQIAEAMARNGKPVVYLNFEMSREQMIAKAISGRTCRKRDGGKYSALDVLQGYRWTPEQKAEILKEAAEYEQEVLQNLQYNPAGISSNLEAIQDYLRRTGEEARKAGKEAPVIIVDYLHLIGSVQRMETQELIKQAVRMLKDYAIENNTFVIAISATNRNSNAKGQITLESGRDSSTIEYTADYQISLNYYAVEKGNVDPGDPEKMAEMQRNPWRQMILRLNKSRFSMPGKEKQVYFYAKGNTFFSADAGTPADPEEWMPADPKRVPFPQARGTAAGAGNDLPVKKRY